MKKRYIYIKILILSVIIYLPLLGSNCNILTTPEVKTPITSTNIQGSWKLFSSTGGSRHDICPGEIANFQANAVSILTCPNQQPISRNYSVDANSVLSFPETGIQYSGYLTNNDTILNLNGMDRVLEYNKINPAYDNITITPDDNIIKNSSEK